MAAATDDWKMLEAPQGMDDAAKVLEELTSVPSIGAAWLGNLSGDAARLSVQYSQLNLAGNSQRKFLSFFTLRDGAMEGQTPNFPVELRDVQLLSVSPSGARTLVVRAGDNQEGAVLEVWGGGRLLKELIVPKHLHGAVFNDGWFSTGAAWSPDEQRVVYVAQAPPPSQTPEWSAPGKRDGQSRPNAAAKGWRGVGEYAEDWGEKYKGMRAPALFVLDVPSLSVRPVAGAPAECSVGQPVFTPSGEDIVCVAWPHRASNFPGLPQRLGMIYCYNRPCSLQLLPVPSFSSSDAEGSAQAKCLTADLMTALSPRFSPKGSTLVFLCNDASASSGAHCATVALKTLAWPSQGEVQTVIEAVQTADPDAFLGLYTSVLHMQPFIAEDRLLLTTQWRAHSKVVEVDLSKKGAAESVREVAVEHADLTPGGSASLLAVSPDWVAVAASSTHSPPQVLVRPAKGGPWQLLRAAPEPWALPAVKAFFAQRNAWKILQVQPTVGDTAHTFEAILMLTAEGGGKKRPTVLTPHGGPHGGFTTAYSMAHAYLTALGYNVLAVNFRGSTGYGEASLQTLPGHVGTNDVADCIAALDAAISEGWVDAERVASVGGSHGGLLTGHLLGQHPDRFKCGILRNPVMSVDLLSQISDIPDWSYVEGYGPKGMAMAKVKPTLEELARMREFSPIRYVDAVRAPMLFLLGGADLRVVKKDAHLYVAALAAREGAPVTKTYVFEEDTHGLERPQTSFEQHLAGVAWLREHM